jgi:hypothetical protein
MEALAMGTATSSVDLVSLPAPSKPDQDFWISFFDAALCFDLVALETGSLISNVETGRKAPTTPLPQATLRFPSVLLTDLVILLHSHLDGGNHGYLFDISLAPPENRWQILLLIGTSIPG